MKRTSPIDEHVGRRLRMRRLMLHMSQSELGGAVGVTFQQVQKYENGSNRISASRLQYMCKTLDVPVAFFFEGAPRVHGLPAPPETEADEEFAALNNFLATSDGLALVNAKGAASNCRARRADRRRADKHGALGADARHRFHQAYRGPTRRTMAFMTAVRWPLSAVPSFPCDVRWLG